VAALSAVDPGMASAAGSRLGMDPVSAPPWTR
jgi:hypothetical protein